MIKPRQADEVGALDARLGEDVLARDHHAHVDDLEVVALQDHGDDVLADVVHVALDGGDDDAALGLDLAAAGHQRQLLGLDVGQQVRHRLLHHARALHHLRQEHLALAEAVADDIHAGHQRAFDDMQRAPAAGFDGAPGLLGIGDDEFGDAMHQRMAQALVHGAGAPGQARAVVLGGALGTLGDLDQALGGGQRRLAGLAGRLSVQHHVLDTFAQFGIELVVDADHAGVDDAHVQPGPDRVVEEDGVDGLAHRVVAAEAEGDVADAAADLRARQVGLDPARGLDEVDGIVVVLLDAGGDGEDVGVEDDVLGREADLIDQDAVGACADLGLARIGIGLALLVEGHHHRGGAITAHQRGLAPEFGLAFLQADAVDDALALDALQAGLDDAPFRAVDHDRHARDLGLAGDQLEEALHRRGRVEHRLVHVDVDDLRAVLDLLARHAERGLVVAGQDHAGEGPGAGDVGALADIDEERAGADGDGLEPGQPHRRRHGDRT